MSAFATAQTVYGKLQGVDVAGIKQFRGVAYGAPTSGVDRFMVPRRPEAWTGVRDAFGHGDIAPQVFVDPTLPFAQLIDFDLHSGGMSEGCLNLNLWTPGLRDGAKRPVLVYFHGGGYSGGSANHHGYTGDRLARFGDVIVVTVNHRLGVLGYLNLIDIGAPAEFAHAGVAGLEDLVLALEWVRDNIEAFGGDPDNVMIFGQSGGGRKVSTLMAMPSAKGLFHKAAVQSGSELSGTSREAGAERAAKLLAHLDLGPDWIRRLVQLPFEAIIDAQIAIGTTIGATEFRPVVDGNVIPHPPFDPCAPEMSADVPLIIGYCLHDFGWLDPRFDLDESGLATAAQALAGDSRAEEALRLYGEAYPSSTPFHRYAAMLTDRDLLQRAIGQAERKAACAKAPVWVYRFDWPSPWRDGLFGAVHALDMGLVFRNAHLPLVGNTPEAEVLAEAMASAWVAFARTGNPNASGVADWTPYTKDDRNVLLINMPHPRMASDPGRALRLFWKI